MTKIGVIPARYQSSRLPGKPLADICGKPMIWWVYNRAIQVKGLDDVIVATDDIRIAEVCNQYDIKCEMTDVNHRTGVDRLSEVSHRIDADYYILIQGDEPLLEIGIIEEMCRRIETDGNPECVYTFKTPIHNPVDVVNVTIIKTVTDLNDRILFSSRSPIPYPKNSIEFDYYKTVGVYAYPRTVIKNYSKLTCGPIETVEEHDIIRMLENGIMIKAFTIETDTISVDTEKDLQRVRKLIAEANNNGKME